MPGSQIRDIAGKRAMVAVNSALAASVAGGAPGSFTPVHAGAPGVPYDFDDLLSQGALGEVTAWLVTEYVVLQDGTQVYWNAEQWVVGATPAHAASAVTPGIPGSFTGDDPLNITDLRQQGALGETTAWTTGQYVVLQDSSNAFWDGDSWEVGTAP